MVNNCCINN